MNNINERENCGVDAKVRDNFAIQAFEWALDKVLGNRIVGWLLNSDEKKEGPSIEDPSQETAE